MKQIRVYCLLSWKRMWKTHRILLTFLLLPFLLLCIRQMVTEEESTVRVAVHIEKLQEKGTEASSFMEALQERLKQREGTVTFYFYDSEEQVKQEVASARAECGYCLPADLPKQLEKGKYTKIIKSYESPQSSLQTICEEVLFAEIFSLYEEATFGEQAAGLINEELEESGKAEGIREETKQELKSRAEELLEKYRYNGSTFQFSYETYLSDPTGEKQEGNFFPIKGILALAIYICGLCGTLDTLEDEKRGRVARLKGRRTFQILTIYIPVLMMSLVAGVSLFLAGEMQHVGRELSGLIAYQLIMIIYCLLLKKLCGKEERLAAAMPVLVLLSVIVCPVFVDLSQFIPFFRILEKAFPMSYYLRM